MKKINVSLSLLLTTLPLCMDATNNNPPPLATHKHVILFIWDGLRPDSITAAHTPNLYRLK